MFKRVKDYFRRPSLFVDEDQKDYSSMMRTNTDGAEWVEKKEKHSEFKKPYHKFGQNYAEMESFHPSNFDVPYYPKIPEYPTPAPGGDGKIPDNCAGSVMRAIASPSSIECGGSALLTLAGHKGDGSSWGTDDVVWSFVHPELACGTVGGGIYRAPDCNQLTQDENCQGCIANISGETECGRSTTSVAVSPTTSGLLVLSGPDEPIVSSCYSSSGGKAPYTWEFNSGGIDSSGCITSINACGASGSVRTGWVTVTDVCGSTETLEVRLPDGEWVSIATCLGARGTNHCCDAAGAAGNCGDYSGSHYMYVGSKLYIISGIGCCDDGTDCCVILGAPCVIPRVCTKTLFPCIHPFSCGISCLPSTCGGETKEWRCP